MVYNGKPWPFRCLPRIPMFSHPFLVYYMGPRFTQRLGVHAFAWLAFSKEVGHSRQSLSFKRGVACCRLEKLRFACMWHSLQKNSSQEGSTAQHNTTQHNTTQHTSYVSTIRTQTYCSRFVSFRSTGCFHSMIKAGSTMILSGCMRAVLGVEM